ncbi:hypothetical protein Ancab_017131 [Ancistrocladus abbreviatus]
MGTAWCPVDGTRQEQWRCWFGGAQYRGTCGAAAGWWAAEGTGQGHSTEGLRFQVELKEQRLSLVLGALLQQVGGQQKPEGIGTGQFGVQVMLQNVVLMHSRCCFGFFSDSRIDDLRRVSITIIELQIQIARKVCQRLGCEITSTQRLKMVGSDRWRAISNILPRWGHIPSCQCLLSNTAPQEY